MCDPKSLYLCLKLKQIDYVRDNEADKCNCPYQCRQLTYEPTISQAALASSVASVVAGDDIHIMSVEEIINDRCIVEVSLLKRIFV